VRQQQQVSQVSALAATMTTVAMGLGSAVVMSDLRILSTNISIVRSGLGFPPDTTIVVSCMATMTLAASVLGAGVLGDRYGMRRMFITGAWGAVAFGLLAAAAPNVLVLMIARAGSGVAFAFLSGLSLAIINAVFPPGRRAGAIARYLALVYLFGLLPALAGGVLAEQSGWRSAFLVTPSLALITLALTIRYVPETQSSHRRTDIPGLMLAACALIALTYGIAELQSGLNLAATGPILAGILAAAVFVWWELRVEEPALELRIFQSRRFSAVVAAGAVNNLVQGGSMTMVTYYLVVIRDQSPSTFTSLLIPATLLAALAAFGAGRAAARFGDCAVVVTGLVILAASLLTRVVFERDTPIMVIAAVMALTAAGGAIVQTPQTTVMMSSAPTNYGGVVSAVKASVAGTTYSLGSALFAVLGIALFIRGADAKLAGTGISARQAGEALGAAARAPENGGADAEQMHWLTAQASSVMIETAHVLNLIMTLAPIAAIMIVVTLFRPKRGAHSQVVDKPAAESLGNGQDR
jgi:MFS family permease